MSHYLPVPPLVTLNLLHNASPLNRSTLSSNCSPHRRVKKHDQKGKLYIAPMKGSERGISLSLYRGPEVACKAEQPRREKGIPPRTPKQRGEGRISVQRKSQKKRRVAFVPFPPHSQKEGNEKRCSSKMQKAHAILQKLLNTIEERRPQCK